MTHQPRMSTSTPKEKRKNFDFPLCIMVLFNLLINQIRLGYLVNLEYLFSCVDNTQGCWCRKVLQMEGTSQNLKKKKVHL